MGNRNIDRLEQSIRRYNIKKALGEIKFREFEREKNELKKIKNFISRIDELVSYGKSSGAIEQIVKKEFPEIASNLENHIIPLLDGRKTNRLRAQIQDRVEKFRNRLEEKSDDGR